MSWDGHSRQNIIYINSQQSPTIMVAAICWSRNFCITVHNLYNWFGVVWHYVFSVDGVVLAFVVYGFWLRRFYGIYSNINKLKLDFLQFLKAFCNLQMIIESIEFISLHFIVIMQTYKLHLFQKLFFSEGHFEQYKLTFGIKSATKKDLQMEVQGPPVL